MYHKGQTWTSEDVRVTSARPSITDIKRTLREVRHGPQGDERRCSTLRSYAPGCARTQEPSRPKSNADKPRQCSPKRRAARQPRFVSRVRADARARRPGPAHQMIGPDMAHDLIQ